MFITYHNILEEVYFTHTHTHKNYHYSFLQEFWNCPCNKLSSCFHQITKSMPTRFAKNVLGLTSVLCIVFITDSFPWLHVERFQSTEVRQFCLGFKVIERSVGIIISHATGAVFYV